MAGLCQPPSAAACCHEDVVYAGQKVAQTLQKRYCTTPIDEIKNTNNSNKRADEGASSITESQGGGQAAASVASINRRKKKGEVHRDIDLGLPSIELDYEPDRSYNVANLGYGNGLKRYLHKRTKMPRAVLSVPKSQIPEGVYAADIEKQLQTLCKVDHPNVVMFRECCEDARSLKLVYEWCEGGLLLNTLMEFREEVCESHIAMIIRELLAALAAAHAFGVHHLDLNLFSLFLAYTGRLSPVKVFGIGLSGFLMQPVSMRKFSKSHKYYYASPEMFSGSVKQMQPVMRHACDVWSAGTLLYTLVSGRPPFGAGPMEEVSKKIQIARWSFSLEFSDYTLSLKDVLEQMLKIPWKARPSAAAVLKHSWVMNSSTLQMKDGKISHLAMSQLHAFAHEDHVKQTIARLLTDIGLTSNSYQNLEKMFNELDLNGDGTISLGELVAAATRVPGMTEKAVEQLVQKLDRNGNLNVDISEFVAAVVMEQEEADERLIKKAFSKMDRNGDARVTKTELFKVLRQYSGSVETKEVSGFVQRTDGDGDQKIDYREFTGLFPQVRGKQDALEKRRDEALAAIHSAPKYLARFQDAYKSWSAKLIHMRDKIQLACHDKHLEGHITGQSYSYIKGHLSEYDVNNMIQDVIWMLRHIPGRNLTRAQKKAKKDKKKRMGEEKQHKKMMGMTSLLGSLQAQKDRSAMERAELEMKHLSGSSGSDMSGSGSGSDDEAKQHLLKESSGLKLWETLCGQDMKEKFHDPEYVRESYWMDYMYWMVKVRADWRWIQPLEACLLEMRESLVEEVIEVVLDRKAELTMMQDALDERYTVREGLRFVNKNIWIPANAHLVPMGAFAKKNLRNVVHLEKMDEMKLPAIFVFAWPKPDVTHQKIEHMRHLHEDKLKWVGRFIDNEVLIAIEHLCKEVSDDLEMSGCLELSMPSPPPSSHLYLKHCEGRELAEDAATPREGQVDLDESSDEDYDELESPNKSKSHMTMSFEQSFKSSNTGSVHFNAPKEKRNKIERNQVLTAAVQAKNEARKKKNARRGPFSLKPA